MNEMLSKLSSYNILNNLLPGAIFCFILKHFIGVDLISESIIDNLFLYYFLGMIISRIGSILVEPLYRKFAPNSFAEYSDYLTASKLERKIDVLSETNNMYRTFLALFIVIAFIKVFYIISEQITGLFEAIPYIVVALLIVLFGIAYRKQILRIKKRVEIVIKEGN